MPRNILAVALLFASASAPALAGDPAATGVPASAAGRIVGLWANDADYGPCGGPATLHGHNTVIFNAGGTLVDNPRAPAGSSLQRSIGVGRWSYHPRTNKYVQHLQFDWFLDGVYDGYQTVDRNALLSNDRTRLAGPVHTDRYNADGSLRARLCGWAVSDRL